MIGQKTTLGLAALMAAALMAAALLAAGCTKEARVPGLRILEEGMNGGGAKVLVDPSNHSSNQWIAGESIGVYMGAISRNTSSSITKVTASMSTLGPMMTLWPGTLMTISLKITRPTAATAWW